jgi:MFS family permease
MLGAVISGCLAGKIGRRPTKIVSGCVFAVGAIWSALSPDVWTLIAARFVLGLGVGTASFVAPMEEIEAELGAGAGRRSRRGRRRPREQTAG